MPCERSCSSCHHRLAISFCAVSFIPRGPPPGGAKAQGGGPASAATSGKGGSGARARCTAPLQVGGGLCLLYCLSLCLLYNFLFDYVIITTHIFACLRYCLSPCVLSSVLLPHDVLPMLHCLP